MSNVEKEAEADTKNEEIVPVEESGSEESESEEEDMYEGLTEEQRKIIEEKQAALKKKFQEHAEKESKQKTKDLTTATGISVAEARIALEWCNNDEMEAASRITLEPDFLEAIKSELDEQAYAHQVAARYAESGEKVQIKIGAAGSNKLPLLSKSKVPSRKAAQGYRLDGEARAVNLRLGDALKKLEDQKKKKELELIRQQREEQEAEDKKQKNSTVETISDNEPEVEIIESDPVETEKEEVKVEWTEEDLKALNWSTARIKAFLNRESNPNAYYYRFNAPGEEQETGEWSTKNKKLFMELIKDGVDYRWGIFSMKIPGRVGYQCSNYYRKLISAGVVEDPNYFIDDKGKLSFQRPAGLKRGTSQTMKINENGVALKRVNSSTSKTSEPKKSKQSKSKAKKKRSGDDYVYADEIDSGADSDTGAYGYGGASNNKKRKMAPKTGDMKGLPADRLVPGLKCPMTFEPIYDPAISPYGHVMGYDTWLRVLGREPKNTCPFTKQRLTRRDLVKLDEDNIEEYRDVIQEAISA